MSEAKMIRVLLVDDHAVVRSGLAGFLMAFEDLELVGEASSGEEAIRKCRDIQPDVILMDEPCSALDPIATSKIENLILELKKDYTVIIVTHNMQQAARVGDETGFMYIGKLIEFGPTTQIFESPQEALTERYITGRFG